MASLRCPVCKAENNAPPTCRRCKADLTLVFTLEEGRAAALAGALAALAAGRWAEALAAARRADALRHDEASGRLVAVAALLCGEYALAWRTHARLTRGAGPG
jgi:hypothetical protein